MKTKMIFILALAAGLCAVHAQQPEAAPVGVPTIDGPSNRAPSGGNDSRRQDESRRQEELRQARAALDQARMKYTENHPEIDRLRRRVNQLDPTSPYSQRPPIITRAGDSALRPASIIFASPHSQKLVDELSEDLTVLNFIFNRNLERVFGDKGPEYRLGVPITMRDNGMIQTSYLQDFGVLVKVHVPFPVFGAAQPEKPAQTTSENTEWEKARRAVYGEPEPIDGTPAASLYDERLVTELKKQMFDAIKNASNIRNLDPNDAITVVISGGANAELGTIDPLTGRETRPDANRPTLMVIRVRKVDAESAVKEPNSDVIAQTAVITCYLDTVNRSSGYRTSYTPYMGGGYGYSATAPPAR